MNTKVKVLSATVLLFVLSFVFVAAFQNRQDTRSRASEKNPTADNPLPQETAVHEEYGEPAGDPSNVGNAFQVIVKDGVFNPAQATIKLDTPILFENEGDSAVEILGDGDIKTDALKHKEKSKPMLFKAEGTYSYYLKSNPQVKGTVNVIK